MMENRLDLPILENRFIEMHKGKCIENIPVSFFNKDKIHLVKNSNQNLIKYIYFLYKNVFFNVLNSNNKSYEIDENDHERISFNKEFKEIENKISRDLNISNVDIRSKVYNKKEMSYFFNEVLENALLEQNIIHILNKDIWNLMKYVYCGYKPTVENNNMNLLIPISDKNIMLSIDSDRSYKVDENFFNLSHYWRMIYSFDRSRNDKDFFISLVLNTFINKNYSNSNESKEINISIAEFIMLNYIKTKNDSLDSSINESHLNSIFTDHVKEISSKGEIFDYNILKNFILHNKNENNISYFSNEILKNIYKQYPVFEFHTSIEAEDDEIILDDEPKKEQNKKTNVKSKRSDDELILDKDPNESENLDETPKEGEDDDASNVDDILGTVPELRDDEDANTEPNNDPVPQETTPVEAESSVYETGDELTMKAFLTKRKIFNLNLKLKSEQVNNAEANILNQWCSRYLWAVTYQQSLKLIKKLKFKLP